MKRSALLLICFVMALCGCHKEFAEEIPSVDTHYVTFNANALGTKTTMSYDDQTGSYSMLWEVGDQITVFEYADGYDYPVKYLSEPLNESDISNNGKSAQFRVDINNPESKISFDKSIASNFKYVAVYPGTFSGGYEPDCEYLNWDGKEKSDPQYDSWCENWGYNGPSVDPHLLLRVVLPYEQSPTANSFDPTANTMVSKVIESDSQIQDMADLQFARIGGIIRITVKGLNDYVGQQITSARFSFGDSFGGSLNCDYDTALEKYKFYKGNNQFELFPNGVTINNDGCADLYIRCYAGEIPDWFSLYITLEDGFKGKGKEEIKVKSDNGDGEKIEGGKGEGPVTLGKYVDLKSLSRSIVVPEGGMGTFGVTSWGVVDVQGVDNISYKVNSTKDGFTATWNDVDNASGYNFWYGSQTNPENMTQVNNIVNNGDGTHSATVTGLAPDTYSIKIIPIPAEGHALVDPNYYYPVDIPVGIPVTQNIFNYYFRENLIEDITTYNDEVLQLAYKNIYKTGSFTLVTAQSKWSLWSINDFCNEIVSITFTADQSTATDNRVYLGETFRPMDYVKVEGSPDGNAWIDATNVEYGTPDTYNNKYPVTYTFPEGIKYFRVSSNDEKLASDIAADAGLMCTFYSIELQVYK